MHLTIRPNCSY